VFCVLIFSVRNAVHWRQTQIALDGSRPRERSERIVKIISLKE
jgi:hypothetical protein